MKKSCDSKKKAPVKSFGKKKEPVLSKKGSTKGAGKGGYNHPMG